MASKSGDSSLHDWFSKSKSSDGKKGWVQLGGKYAGKPCAKQPGQTTKPKCGSSKMKRDLNKDEEQAAFRRKNKKDPNPNRKGKAINVATEETSIDEKCWDGYTQKGMKKKGKKVVPNCVKEEDKKLKTVKTIAKELDAAVKTHKSQAERLRKAGVSEETVLEKAGEKDACYKKVKASAKVWPSAYASGRLVQCRKKGAANYGNSTKKEEFEGLLSFKQFQEKCWDGYTQKGMKKKGKKVVPNCVPVGEDKVIDENVGTGKARRASMGNIQPRTVGAVSNDELDAEYKKKKAKDKAKDVETANKVDVSGLSPSEALMRKKAAERKAERVRIRASKMRREGFVNEHHQKDTDGKVIEHGDGTPSSVEEGAAWTKKEGKNKSGGLNEKGRKSYEKENPGSDLKAPSKKVGNPRRKSFCARMKGMRKRQKPSNNTGDDRLSKSLRAWNC